MSCVAVVKSGRRSKSKLCTGGAHSVFARGTIGPLGEEVARTGRGRGGGTLQHDGVSCRFLSYT